VGTGVDDDPGGLDRGVALEIGPDEAAVPGPVVLGVGGAMDAEEALAGSVPGLEGGLLRLVEDIAGGVQEDRRVESGEALGGELGGVLGGVEGKAVLGGEFPEAGDAIGDGGVAEPGGAGEDEDVEGVGGGVGGGGRGAGDSFES